MDPASSPPFPTGSGAAPFRPLLAHAPAAAQIRSASEGEGTAPIAFEVVALCHAGRHVGVAGEKLASAPCHSTVVWRHGVDAWAGQGPPRGVLRRHGRADTPASRQGVGRPGRTADLIE